VVIAGDLTVGGTLTAGRMVLEASEEASSEESEFGRLLEVKDGLGETKAWLDASGSAYFAEVETKKLIIAGQQATVSGQQASEVTTNATAGQAVLPAGEEEVTIKSPHVGQNTLVYITPISDTQNKVLYVKAKKLTYNSTGGS